MRCGTRITLPTHGEPYRIGSKMMHSGRRLMFALACLVILGRSQGSAGFCIHPHDHSLSAHHQHEHSECVPLCHCDAHDHHLHIDCCCHETSGDRDDCSPISVLLDTIEKKDSPASSVLHVASAGSECDLDASVRPVWLEADSGPTLASLRTVILIV